MRLHEIMQKYGIQSLELHFGTGSHFRSDGLSAFDALMLTLRSAEQKKGVFVLTEHAINLLMLDNSRDDNMILSEITEACEMFVAEKEYQTNSEGKT